MKSVEEVDVLRMTSESAESPENGGSFSVFDCAIRSERKKKPLIKMSTEQARRCSLLYCRIQRRLGAETMPKSVVE